MSVVKLFCGDVLDVLPGNVKDAEAVVQDSPSGINFMGRSFDVDHGGDAQWIAHMTPRFAAARESCIPGGYGVYWAIPRTQDWTMQALRRAGYHIVDVINHAFGQGHPKAKSQLKPSYEVWILCRDPRGPVRPLNIDACRVQRSWAERPESWFRSGHSAKPDAEKIAGAPPGNGIRPHEAGSWTTNCWLSHAPCCAQVGVREVRGSAPASGPTRTGASTSQSRGEMKGTDRTPVFYGQTQTVPTWECLAACECGLASLSPTGGDPTPCPGCDGERWWACPVAEIDGQSGDSTSRQGEPRRSQHPGEGWGTTHTGAEYTDAGGASRYFVTLHYDAKAATAERQAGCGDLLWVKDKRAPIGWRLATQAEYDAAPPNQRATGNVHPTIKRVGCGDVDGLMRRLVRLVTPEGGPVVDGMMGSGSTGVAARIEGRDFYGGDIDPGAVAIAGARIGFWSPEVHRRVLADNEVLRAEERRVRRERALRDGPTLEDLPLFGKR